MTKLRSLIKYPGGKSYLASWITENFPPNCEDCTYVEPFAGAANVLLQKEPSKSIEVLNDSDLGVIQIFRALRDEPKLFVARLRRLKYSEGTFARALNRKEFSDYMDHAINEFVLRRMSRGGLKKTFSWSKRLRGGQPGDLNAWNTMMDSLPDIADRIKDVFLLNQDAIGVIKAFNNQDTVLYCDPPYLHSTRIATNIYEEEMNTDAHIGLADALNQFKGRAIISGYASSLYRHKYPSPHWRCVRKNIATHAAQGKTKSRRLEHLWLNFCERGHHLCRPEKGCPSCAPAIKK